MKELVNKIAIFFGGEDFYEKGEEARLEFSPSELREINNLIIENSRLKEKLKNTNWHTGTPTEEGWYLLAVKHGEKIHYNANRLYSGGEWFYSKLGEVLAYQKIEPYEDSNGRCVD